MDIILPYKWKTSSWWDLAIQAWLVSGTFFVGKKMWVVYSYQDDKEDMSEIHDSLRAFWRKRGAM